LFSLVYYGFLFPNTAYAKLGGGIEHYKLILQGIIYLVESSLRDPTTLFTIITAFFVPFWIRKLWPLTLGILLTVIYVINVGGDGVVVTDGREHALGYKDALYVGRGVKEVIFRSKDPRRPAHFYLNSANAHTAYPVKRVTLADAEVVTLGSPEESNHRQINKLLVHGVVDTCQLQMGMTELKPGSVWNTMPAHVHSRRMEAYFYFNVPQGQAICHFMGEPQETRHIWLGNEQAVISPPWSIHAAAGTSNYIFIWGMAGENLDYGDMDFAEPTDLK